MRGEAALPESEPIAIADSPTTASDRAPLSGRLLDAGRAPVVLFVGYAIAMLLLAVSSLIDFRNARDLETSAGDVSRALEAVDKLRQIGNTFLAAETSERGYLLTGNGAYLQPYQRMRGLMPVRLSEIEQLISDTPEQRAWVARLRTLAKTKFDEMDGTLDAYHQSDRQGAVASVVAGDAANTMEAVRTHITDMLAEQTGILAERRRAAASVYSAGLVRALVSTGIVALALTVLFLLMHRFLRQRDAALAVVEANNADLEQRVADRTADLSHLSRHLLNVREHEKKVIARDLHDDFGSYLTAINMDVSRARDKIAVSHPEQAAKLDRTLGLLGNAIELKRQLITNLRPSMLDNLGLGAALEQYIDEWATRNGIAATFDHEGDLQSDDEGCPIAVFRVFQEALANIAKHSKANRVAASAYRVGDAIEFEIADNGIGMTEADRAKPGVHGLLGIRERVLAYHGHVEFTTGTAGGTIVRAIMPCKLPADEAGAARYPVHFA